MNWAKLVVAAVIAAVPLFFEAIRDIRPKPDHEGYIQYFRWGYAVSLIATDALGGYVFARMAANQGMPVSDLSAASAAGAVFGSLTFLARAVTGCIALIGHGTNSTIFGHFELVESKPIRVTEDEYRAVVNSQMRIIAIVARITKSMLKRMMGCATCPLCCCPCMSREERREFREDMREDWDVIEI